MKKYVFTCLSIALLSFSFTNLHAEEKNYLDANLIIIGNNGIFAKIDGNVIPVPCLAYDEDGLYIQSSLIPEVSTWYCKRCEKHVISYYTKCPGCNKGPKEE